MFYFYFYSFLLISNRFIRKQPSTVMFTFFTFTISMNVLKETTTYHVISPRRAFPWLFSIFVFCRLYFQPAFTCSKSVIVTPEQCFIDTILVSSLLTLNRFRKLFWFFYYWLWTRKCRLVSLLLTLNIFHTFF